MERKCLPWGEEEGHDKYCWRGTNIGVNIYSNSPNTPLIQLQGTITGSSEAWGEQRKFQEEARPQSESKGTAGARGWQLRYIAGDVKLNLKLGKEIYRPNQHISSPCLCCVPV